MIRLPMFVALVLALSACTESPAPAGPDAEAGPAMSATGPAPEASTHDEAAVAAAVEGEWRNPDFRARDGYRNPAATLGFFGVAPHHTVVEITPGGGWYMEILAPLVREDGRYIGAVIDPARATTDGQRNYAENQNAQLREKLAASPEVYGPAALYPFDPVEPVFGEPGSADVVLTFRNVHNWRMGGNAEAMFEGFYEVLAPGGVLGVVEHRAAADVPADDRSGYVGQDQVIALAEAAGFELDASSEINANPADTKDHPNGVWTLPPSNRHEPEDAETYTAIGESDRMTLRFRKPLD
jgi:predicted methyltransferase